MQSSMLEPSRAATPPPIVDTRWANLRTLLAASGADPRRTRAARIATARAAKAQDMKRNNLVAFRKMEQQVAAHSYNRDDQTSSTPPIGTCSRLLREPLDGSCPRAYSEDEGDGRQVGELAWRTEALIARKRPAMARQIPKLLSRVRRVLVLRLLE